MPAACLPKRHVSRAARTSLHLIHPARHPTLPRRSNLSGNDLDDGAFSGSSMATVGSMQNLVKLDLSDNKFIGLASSFSQLTSLISL